MRPVHVQRFGPVRDRAEPARKRRNRVRNALVMHQWNLAAKQLSLYRTVARRAVL